MMLIPICVEDVMNVATYRHCFINVYFGHLRLAVNFELRFIHDVDEWLVIPGGM